MNFYAAGVPKVENCPVFRSHVVSYNLQHVFEASHCWVRVIQRFALQMLLFEM